MAEPAAPNKETPPAPAKKNLLGGQKEILSYQAIIVLSLLVALLSGYTAAYRYVKTVDAEEPAPVLIKRGPVAPKEEKPTVSVQPPAPKPAPAQATPPSLDLEKAKTATDVHALLPRNILFTYINYRSKKVELAGDFNEWKGLEMKKEKPGVWRARLSVAPGIYKYNFISDGKKVTDPYNPRREKSASILIVEPMEQKR
ncbi:MAG: hypothetical protein HYT79_03785 [Elusimicrobia bacterium]|nr:hypothetical protein [Elusimicrobiota bacterium]